MTSKSSFWKYSNWNFKKRAWTFAVCAVVWFFVIPVATFMNMDAIMRSINNGSDVEWIKNSLINTHISGSGVYGFLTVVMAIFLGIQAYAWNNHQKKVDMYRAVPVKASYRFWYINLNSLFIYFITFGLSLLVANIIVASHGIWEMIYMKATLYSFFLHLLLFVATYFVVLIAQYLTGNLVLGVIGSCILIVLEPLCQILDETLKAAFYKTYVSVYRADICENGLFSPLVPYVSGFKSISMQEKGWADPANYGDVTLPIILFVVQIVLYGSLAYVLYQKKPAQMGGKAMAFPRTKPVIKCFLLVVESIGAALIMTAFTGDYVVGYGVFGLVCGLLIGHAILQSIMEGGFRDIFKGKISLAVSAVIALGIYLGFAFDVTGYDTYLPEGEEVESFAITRYSDYVYDLYDENGNYISTQEYAADHMAITDEIAKNTLIKLLQKAIEEDTYTYKGDYEYTEEQVAEHIYVKFRLKNGREVERTYCIPEETAEECYEVVYMAPGYKECIYMVYHDIMEEWMNREDLKGGINYTAYGTIEKGYNEKQVELLKEFYQALRVDIAARNAETVLTKVPVGCVELVVYFDERSSSVNIPVYENDINTMKLIEEKGWYYSPKVESEDVKAMLVNRYDGSGEKFVGLKPGDTLFEEVASALVWDYALNYVPNQNSIIDGAYYVEVMMSVNGVEDTRTCRLERRKLPQELEEAFESVESISSPEDYITLEDVLAQ